MTSQPYFTGARGRRRSRAVPPAPTAPAGVPGRVLTLLAALTAALGAAFVYAPRWLAAASTSGGGFPNQRSLIEALRDAFVGYWASDSRNFAPPMQRVVDYWFRYHVAKAAIAALLLGVLIRLSVLLWRTYLRTGLGARGAAVACAWGLAVMLALFSAVLVTANVQGAVMPFASLLSMLPAARPDGPFTAAMDQVRQGLVHYSGADGRTSPALRGMVDDYTLYHVVVVVIAVIAAMLVVGMGIRAGKRFARAKGDRRARRAFGMLAVTSAVVLLAVIVVGAADATTVAQPAPKLLAAFQNGR